MCNFTRYGKAKELLLVPKITVGEYKLTLNGETLEKMVQISQTNNRTNMISLQNIGIRAYFAPWPPILSKIVPIPDLLSTILPSEISLKNSARKNAVCKKSVKM
jgi:hypothetical protein